MKKKTKTNMLNYILTALVVVLFAVGVVALFLTWIQASNPQTNIKLGTAGLFDLGDTWGTITIIGAIITLVGGLGLVATNLVSIFGKAKVKSINSLLSVLTIIFAILTFVSTLIYCSTLKVVAAGYVVYQASLMVGAILLPACLLIAGFCAFINVKR